MQKSFFIPKVGNVIIIKKNRVKNLTIRIKNAETVNVTIPYFVSYKSALDFVLKNQSWIKEKQGNIVNNTQKEIFSPDSLFKSRKYSLDFITLKDKKLFAKINQRKIIIYYPEDFEQFSDEIFQNFIIKMIEKALRIEAEEFLIPKAKYLSETTGLKFRNIKIGSGHSRLGSCNAFNDITLSKFLVLLPEHLVDYIILHELAHIKYKNHSKDFYNFLNDLTNNKVKDYKKELQKFDFSIKPGNYSYSN